MPVYNESTDHELLCHVHTCVALCEVQKRQADYGVVFTLSASQTLFAVQVRGMAQCGIHNSL